MTQFSGESWINHVSGVDAQPRFKVGDRVRYIGHMFDVPRGAMGTIAEENRGGAYPYSITVDGRDYGDAVLVMPEELTLVEPKDSPRVGDVVRVVLEGKVTYVSGRGFDVAGENTIPHSGAEHVKSVEIITPAKPSVADLPVGSVVKSNLSGQAYAKVATDDWRKAGFTSRYEDTEIDRFGWTLLVEQASE